MAPPSTPACPAAQGCGTQCCQPGQSCCSGECCTGTCTNGLCCPPQTVACGSICCPSEMACCGNLCCDPTLCSASGSHCCASGTVVCGNDCCSPEDTCCDGECCAGVCYAEETCCPRPRIFCKGGCCPPADITCCAIDGCCDGTCTNGGLCCPDGTNVCGETCCDNTEEKCCGAMCIPVGGCCTDQDCAYPQTCGGGGVPNTCGCTVVSSCERMGFTCGTFTNNCGEPEYCGDCAAPETCNGSPAGMCLCVSDETCDGRCGSFTDVCGVIQPCEPCPTTSTTSTPTTTPPTATTMQPAPTTTTAPVCLPTQTCASRGIVCGSFVDDCGVNRICNECPSCRTCSAEGTCVVADDGTSCGGECTVGGFCLAGNCINIFPRNCGEEFAGPCERLYCDPAVAGGCVRETAQFEGQRGCSSNPCDPGICSEGSCLSDPVVCPACKVCDPSDGRCVDNPGLNGNSCGSGDMVCVQGECCNMLGGGPLVLEFHKECISETICCAEGAGPCCPGTSGQCCENCFAIENAGGEFQSGLCCPAEQMCNGECCWFGSSCVGGTTCVRDEQICENGTCNDQCCGGTGVAGSGQCCGPSAYCVGTACVPVQACTDGSAGDAACVAGGFGASARCVGGSCCPSPVVVGVGSTGLQYSCCGPEERRSASGRCCGYPNYTGQCIDCSCSFSRVRRLTR